MLVPTINLLVLSFFITIASSEETGLSCQKQCEYGCCPHANGVCCQGGTECCREGQTCIPHVNMCIGLNSTAHGNFSLYSENTTPVGGLLCPEGTTTCSNGCCPYANAVCCNDGHGCCPEEFQCTSNGCVSNSGGQSVFLRKSLAAQEPENSANGQRLKDMGIKICPDKLHLCPGTADCCRRENGTWDCCPKASNVRGECCNQMGFIWVCCTDLAPKCYWWGCWFS
ncbi:granulin [Nephila pilipes]|uniref:Granulin n=1 Tax=Nephila pilipes TaxID=299642 RepID=A0A8X6UBK5_NEPPI|nr:granulin [Nephila pilipes]